MGTLIIHLDSSFSKSKAKEVFKKIPGVKDVTDKLTADDLEDLIDNSVFTEMKKADKTHLLSFEEGKIEFLDIKKRLSK